MLFGTNRLSGTNGWVMFCCYPNLCIMPSAWVCFVYRFVLILIFKFIPLWIIKRRLIGFSGIWVDLHFRTPPLTSNALLKSSGLAESVHENGSDNISDEWVAVSCSGSAGFWWCSSRESASSSSVKMANSVWPSIWDCQHRTNRERFSFYDA